MLHSATAERKGGGPFVPGGRLPSQDTRIGVRAGGEGKERRTNPGQSECLKERQSRGHMGEGEGGGKMSGGQFVATLVAAPIYGIMKLRWKFWCESKLKARPTHIRKKGAEKIHGVNIQRRKLVLNSFNAQESTPNGGCQEMAAVGKERKGGPKWWPSKPFTNVTHVALFGEKVKFATMTILNGFSENVKGGGAPRTNKQGK